MSDDSIEKRPGFDEELAGRYAECDGGGPIEGTRYSGRQDFAGTLTGEYVDVGDPAMRWYLMVDLQVKPEGFVGDVWCLSGNLFLVEPDAN